MTPEFLRALQADIMANAECAPYIITPDMGKVDGAAKKDHAIAGILSATRTRITSMRVGELGILAKHPGGPIAADAVLGKLEEYAATAGPLSRLAGRAMRGIRSADGLDLGDPSTQAMLGALAQAGVLAPEEAAALAGLARVPDTITADHVSRALRGPWGDE